MAQCVAMVGGGLGSFMGKVHRQAIGTLVRARTLDLGSAVGIDLHT